MKTPNFQFPTPKRVRSRRICSRQWALGVGSWELACALTMACALSTACGKKGPPLLPFVRQPKAAEITSARRVGNDVYLTITVPTANVDDSTPASVAQIQVLAVTAGTPPS